MEIQRRRTCIVKQAQKIKQIIITQTQECMETRCTKRAQAVAEQHRGTAIPLAFLTRAFLSSIAEPISAVVLVLACSISSVTMALATAASRSVRSWSHFRCDNSTNCTVIFLPNVLIYRQLYYIILHSYKEKLYIMQEKFYRK